MNWAHILAALIGGGIGGAATVTALSRWLGDLWLGRILAREKARYDKELEELRARYTQELTEHKNALERSKNVLQARIDRSTFVTRAHFETEFEAYKKIFEDVAEVRLTMSAMHPILRVSPEGETREDRAKELSSDIRKLSEFHNKAVRTVENLAPFYPEEIFEKLEKCLQVVRIEILSVQTAGDRTFSSEWRSEGEQRVDQFMRAYRQVSEAVRQRIATLAILPTG